MLDQSSFYHNAEKFLRAQVLWPNERIKWSGCPDAQRSLWFKWWHCLIGTVLLALVLPLYSFPAHIREFDFFSTFILLWLLWMAMTPVRNYIQARRTAYFVTDQRIFIVQNFNPDKITILTKEDITDYRMTRAGEGKGDIQLKLNRSKSRNLYEEDKQRMMTNMGRLFKGGDIVKPTAVSPFMTYRDGFWGVDHVSDANAAIKDLVESKEAEN